MFGRIVPDNHLPKTVRLHDLRHSFASLLLAVSGGLKTVSSALGHSANKCHRRHLRGRESGDDSRRGRSARSRGYVRREGQRRMTPTLAQLVRVGPNHRAFVAGACRNRTYQSPCGDLSDFEDRAGHQTRTLPRMRNTIYMEAFRLTCAARGYAGRCG